jgi:DNA-binding transcriptional MerR regulator
MPHAFTIGEAAQRAGVTADTLRYYERQGVLPRAHRTAAGYRVYSEAAIERIQLVRSALRFGFAVKQLASFLQACDGGRPPCRQVRAAGGQLLDEMERRIAEMTAARDRMRVTLADWDRALDEAPAGVPARLLTSIARSP